MRALNRGTDKMSEFINITPAAEEYLASLLAKQNIDGMAVRVFITQPGTKYAETCLAYCRPEEINVNDEKQVMEKLLVYVEAMSVPYLEESVIDYAKDRMGGQLTIKAPNAKMPKVGADSPVEDRIKYLLYTEINPGLASHGGDVTFIKLEEDGTCVLEFGGGCRGCSGVDITLKEGVEKTMVARIPEVQRVEDITDHSDSTNAYYK